MPFKRVRQDIVKMKCDAIVNPTNPELCPGGGVDKKIEKAAGVNLFSARMKIKPIKTGEAKITPGFNLPAKYIIHTVGPVWQDGKSGEPELLRKCYENVLQVAKENDCHSIAIPLISTGTFGFPVDDSLKIAISVIGDFLLANDDFDIYLVMYDDVAYEHSKKIFEDVEDFLIENGAYSRFTNERIIGSLNSRKRYLEMQYEMPDLSKKGEKLFVDKVCEFLSKKRMSDPVCYKRAKISKSSWSKVVNAREKNPTRNFAIRTAIGLELTLDEAKELLEIVGYALSKHSRRDLIIQYAFMNKLYDVDKIEELLLKNDCESLLN